MAAHHKPNGNNFRSRVHFLQCHVNVDHRNETFLIVRVTETNQLRRTATYVQRSSCVTRQRRNLRETICQIRHKMST